MNPFEPGSTEIPSPPFEVPTPEVPNANFIDIGAAFEKGRQSVQTAAAGLPKFLDWLGDAVGLILGTIMSLVERLIAFVIGIYFKIFNNAEGGTDQIAAQAVGGIFGVNVPSQAFTNGNDRAAREAVAEQIATTVLNGLFPGAVSTTPRTLEPGHDVATKFLNMTTHMAIEGWLQGWIIEACSLGQIETFAELKDIMERTLGLGRLARRVMAAPVKILAEGPFEAELNKLYRPKHMSESVAVREYIRGLLDLPALQEALARQGYTDAEITAAINFNRSHISPADIEVLLFHGNMDETSAIKYLTDQGFDQTSASFKLQALKYPRYDSWNHMLVTEALAGLAAGKLTRFDFDNVLNNSGLPADQANLIGKVADLKQQFHQKHLSPSEAEQLVIQGLATIDAYTNALTREGYTPDAVSDLELLLLVKIQGAADKAQAKKDAAAAKAARAKAAAAKAAAQLANAAAEAEAKGVSVSKFETLVKDGYKTIADYQTFLKGKGLSPDNIAAFTSALQATLAKGTTGKTIAANTTAAAKAKGISLATLEAATKAGIMTVGAFEQRLTDAGFDAADIQILSELVQDAIDAAKVKADNRTAAIAKAAVKHVDLAQEEKAVRLGLATLADYSAFLDAHGYDPVDRDLLLSELTAQLAADQAAANTKKSAAAQFGHKGLTLRDTERLVRAGQMTIADYQAALVANGYSPDAQAQLVSLLQLQMQQDQQHLAASGHASALIGESGLSLADLARAVKVGVLPIATYTQALTDAGLSDSDAQTLTLALAAQVKSSKATGAATKTAAQLVSQSGLSLATLEADVLAGRLTVAQFEGILTAAGVTQSDMVAIVGVLTDELANKAAVAQLQSKATQAAAAKGLSLGQEAAAVRNQVKTLEDYQAFVTSLGYNVADATTLVNTLAAQMKVAPPAPTSNLPPTV